MAKKKKAKASEETKTETTVEETGETTETEPVEAEVPEPEEAPENAELDKLREELEQQKDKYWRLAAEYDNYRKRTANEKLSIYDDATAKAVTELLPVADSVGRALDNLKDADPEVLKGIELIQSQLDRSFEKLKVESYGAVGDDFDPKLHEAIATVESDELASDKIAAVFQTGYKIGDKVIRHAMVQVVS